MFGNPYYNNTQVNIDKIDNQIRELENLRSHLQKPQPSINQTFQLAPTQPSGLRFVSGLDEVTRELVFSDSVFFNKEFTNMWLKDVKGNIKIYDLKEIVPKDDKDFIIENLQREIEVLKKEMNKNEKSDNSTASEPVEGEEPSSVSEI